MKKLVVLLLIVTTAISMTACKTEDKTKQAQTTNVETSQKELAASEQTTAAKKQKKEKNSQKKTTEAPKETSKKQKKDSEKKFFGEKTSEVKEKATTAKSKTTKTTERSQQTTAQSETTKKEEEKRCSIVISCQTVLQNKDKLQSNYQVPSGGRIYSNNVKIQKGDTVMDILKRTGVSIDTSKGYVQGIDGLYEFDCGKNSGWMYKVNGSFPNTSADNYTVEDGDSIQWLYTCKRGDI